jgi:hypothetical protein
MKYILILVLNNSLKNTGSFAGGVFQQNRGFRAGRIKYPRRFHRDFQYTIVLWSEGLSLNCEVMVREKS